ncbi:hypothetical protein KIL84_006692 [Mauremys mutica]|uniref:Uncharacterized protein n=1 Tax=Mauremys mutica TaxID=74926 RepID=A0A9D4AUT3_9SAUR|nr:hypothetical protein KIL84_006692 [Mauremys mutica]
MAHANPQRQGLWEAGDVQGNGTVKADILGTGKATILEEQLMPLTPTLSTEAYSGLGVGAGKGYETATAAILRTDKEAILGEKWTRFTPIFSSESIFLLLGDWGLG